MNETANSAVTTGMAAGVVLFLIVIFLAVYVFYCFCYKRTCEKCGVTPGVLIWIPIAQFVPLLQVAKMPLWMVILLLIPIVGFVVFLMMWVKICQARGKSGWLVLLFFIPVANIFVIPYLAFSE